MSAITEAAQMTPVIPNILAARIFRRAATIPWAKLEISFC
jgi:hypothetical protein